MVALTNSGLSLTTPSFLSAKSAGCSTSDLRNASTVRSAFAARPPSCRPQRRASRNRRIWPTLKLKCQRFLTPVRFFSEPIDAGSVVVGAVVPPPRPFATSRGMHRLWPRAVLDRHATFLDVATRETLWKPTDARIGDRQTWRANIRFSHRSRAIDSAGFFRRKIQVENSPPIRRHMGPVLNRQSTSSIGGA